MNKQEFYQKVKEKISQADFDKLYVECEKEAKERGVDAKDLVVVTLGLMSASLKKRLQSPAKEFEGIIFGINQQNNLNAIVDKIKQHSLEEKRKNADEAFKNGLINEKGEPIWHSLDGKAIPEFKVNKSIDEDDYQQTLMMLAKQPEETTLKITRLTMRGKKRLNDSTLLFKKLTFRANLSQKSTDDLILLNQSTLTEFKVEDEKEINFEDYAKKFLRKNCVALSKISDYIAKRDEKNYDDFVIVKGNVSNINITAPGISNIINLDDLDMDFDSIVTCWVDEDYKIDIMDSAVGVIVIGRATQGERDSKTIYSINTFGIWAPENQKIKVRPQEIKIEKVVSKPETEEAW